MGDLALLVFALVTLASMLAMFRWFLRTTRNLIAAERRQADRARTQAERDKAVAEVVRLRAHAARLRLLALDWLWRV
jgi:hypothetical protein